MTPEEVEAALEDLKKRVVDAESAFSEEGPEGPPGPIATVSKTGETTLSALKKIGPWKHEPGLVEATQNGIGSKENHGVISATNDAFVVLAMHVFVVEEGRASVTAEVEGDQVAFFEIELHASQNKFVTVTIPVQKGKELYLTAACSSVANEASIQVLNVALLE